MILNEGVYSLLYNHDFVIVFLTRRMTHGSRLPIANWHTSLNTAHASPDSGPVTYRYCM